MRKFKLPAAPGRLSRMPALSGVILALIPLYFELLIHTWVSGSLIDRYTVGILYLALALGGLLSLIDTLLPSPAARKWFAFGAALLLAVMYMTEFFIQDAFRNYMAPRLIFSGAGGIANGFMDVVASLLLRGWWRILLALAPAIVLALLPAPNRYAPKYPLAFAALTLVGILTGLGALYGRDGDLSSLTAGYNFDDSVRYNGMAISMCREFFGSGLDQQENTFVIAEIPMDEPAPTAPAAAAAPGAPAAGAAETAPSAEPRALHTLDLDFAALSNVKVATTYTDLFRYLATVKPSAENEYTGLFKGKNLIFITAEAFTSEVIDPERTPTLYRLANQGIKFKEFYQPGWQGGTSSGELANISGIVPNPASGMMEFSSQKPFTTIGRMLMNEGYFSRAYHNNDMGFYNREQTHANLGYEKFIAFGNGMEEGVKSVWPESDLEMMEFTVPQYIDQQPFSIYYMTVSGHSVYEYSQNAQTRKHYDEFKDLDYTDPVICYLAANQELECAMTYLVQQLEDAGIADDTVIVISPDHFPYGLTASTTWGNNENHLNDLFKVKGEMDNFTRDHSALIIWSGCLEGKNITVDAPTYSLDILPTICNLFGVEYDSRLYVGRDVFSDTPALVIWPGRSWITEKGRYEHATNTFTPNEGVTVSDDYIKAVTAEVQNKINYSRIAQSTNFFVYLKKQLDKTADPEEMP